MSRRLFALASVVSLLLCMATATLWVRSRTVLDQVFYAKKEGHLWRIKSRGGALQVELLNHWDDDERLWMTYPYRAGVKYDSFDGPTRLLSRRTVATIEIDRGLHHWNGSPPNETFRDYYLVLVPYRTLLPVACVLPLSWLTGRATRTLRRRRRQTMNRCPACDYDLTGNTSGVCPECGSPTPRDRLRSRA